MFLKKGESELFFVHIPRSGGRYINYLFKDLNGYDSWYGMANKFYKGVEQMHLHLKLLKELPEYISSPKFTVVRNPVDRFISMMTADFSLHNHLNKKLIVSDLKVFKIYLKDTPIYRAYFTNWFKPQYEFIGKDCKIWRYEDGFGKSFHDFLYKEFNIVLKVKKQKIIAPTKFDNNKTLKLKPEFIKEVKKFYRKDYTLLGDYA